MNTDIFDAVFWTFFITTTIGFLLAFTKMIYKSKCKEISCCGLKISRDTEAEEHIDQLEIERHQETKEENKSIV